MIFWLSWMMKLVDRAKIPWTVKHFLQCFQWKQMSPIPQTSLWWQFQLWSCDLENYCNPLYFRVFFISQFCDWKFVRGNFYSWCTMLSYMNSIHADILRELWIREWSNSRILAKNKVFTNNSEFTVDHGH